MIKELSLNDFVREFKDYNREDNFSYEGLEQLYNYYSEFENFKIDVIAICCDWCEYDDDELLNQYGDELEFKEFKEDNKDCYEDDEYLEEYIKEVVQELERQAQIIKLSEGYLIASC